MIRDRSASLYPIQLAISARLRPHPMQRPETGSTVQILLHGLAIAGGLATTVMDVWALRLGLQR
jgi:hypothetical protein